MKKLTAERAEELKAQGITHIASIIRSCYNTEYYKWESIDTILANGGRMPEYPIINNYTVGINGRRIDWAHTICWSKI